MDLSEFDFVFELVMLKTLIRFDFLARYMRRISGNRKALAVSKTDTDKANTLQLKDLMNEISVDVERTKSYTGRAKFDKRVIEALYCVPRIFFVPDSVKPMAYKNRPLPIGHNQTISQPWDSFCSTLQQKCL